MACIGMAYIVMPYVVAASIVMAARGVHELPARQHHVALQRALRFAAAERFFKKKCVSSWPLRCRSSGLDVRRGARRRRAPRCGHSFLVLAQAVELRLVEHDVGEQVFASYGLYSYGLHRYGLYSHYLYSHDLNSYGLCGYGLFSNITHSRYGL